MVRDTSSRYENSTLSPVKEAWGTWLSGLYPWDWWVTLTFRDPPVGGTWTRPGWSFAKKGWRAFEKRVRPSLGPLAYVRAFEIQEWRGAPHIHALVGGLDDTRYAPARDWWWEYFGIASIEEYNPELGAGFYVSKYVSKELGDIEFSNNLSFTQH